MSPRGRVAVIDDDRAMCEMLEEGLTDLGFEVRGFPSASAALAGLAELDVDVVVTDLNMPAMNGLELARRVAGVRPDVPIIVITAFGSMEAAIAAIRAGVWDFVTKPLELDALGLAVERAVRHRALHREVRRLREAVAASARFDDILGASPPMRRMFEVLERVAQQDVTLLVTGESGTGKELVARAVHARSPRSGGPFVAINCAAMPEALLESELFGHVRGAFTDARTARSGLFFQADRGTLFLDEMGDLPPALQPKLLRALQERAARPIGGDREQPFDIRLVAATNRNLEADVEAGRFREDLYYRVNVVQIVVPPLRFRGADILVLAQHHLERAATRMAKPVTGISRPAAERLLAYAWPGNVRELQNCMERSVALAQHDLVTVEDLPDRVVNAVPEPAGAAGEDPSEILSMDEVERRHILRVLAVLGGSKSLAARALGLDRTTLYRKLDRYGTK